MCLHILLYRRAPLWLADGKTDGGEGPISTSRLARNYTYLKELLLLTRLRELLVRGFVVEDFAVAKPVSDFFYCFG